MPAAAHQCYAVANRRRVLRGLYAERLAVDREHDFNDLVAVLASRRSRGCCRGRAVWRFASVPGSGRQG